MRLPRNSLAWCCRNGSTPLEDRRDLSGISTPAIAAACWRGVRDGGTTRPEDRSRVGSAGASAMVKGLWNYAIKVAGIERAIAFYDEALGAKVRLRGEVLGCAYALLRLGEARLILFEKAPYEDLLGTRLPLGFLHDVYEVDDFDAQIARLREAGVRFLMAPQVIEADFGKRKIAFFETPDGMRTEVMQILEVCFARLRELPQPPSPATA
jgi:catechol 2,3-dioxygenase-like lactoylglutathione lyase family enzyme